MKRRNFVANSVALTAGILSTPASAHIIEDVKYSEVSKPILKFGVCTDLHQDVMPDGERRLQAFITAMQISKPDFIIQLGDFCSPHQKNRALLEIWDQFNGPSFHVIGNHDTDYGFTHQQVVDFWKAKGIYYSFDINGYHIVVLNGNERAPNDASRWPSHISDAQIEWLEQDLATTALPTLVFCHQGLDIDLSGAIEKASRVRVVLERANQKAGFQKVQVVFSGHHHQDYHNVINSIHYVQINSMSYYWMGSEYRQLRYSKETDEQYPLVKDTAPYEEPIWALVSIYGNGRLELEGKQTKFVSPSPTEMGMAVYAKVYPVVSRISNRKFNLV